MRYFILIGDGMADAPMESLGGKTPLAAAHTEAMDTLARGGRMGLVRTVPQGCAPGSDTGILTLLGYDPRTYLTGRSALEAAGCGIPLAAGQAVCRCNFVTVSQGRLRSYSAGELSGESTAALLDALRGDGPFSALASSLGLTFFPEAPFRLLCIGPAELLGELETTPPHEILDRPVNAYLPTGPGGAAMGAVMQEARRVLAGTPPHSATDLWPWAPGRAMALPAFASLHKKRGVLITATPLVRGIGALAGLSLLCPPGATGDPHTDYRAKAEAAIACFEEGQKLVIVHVEAPDACSHSRDLPGKLRAIEAIDRQLLAPVARYLSRHPSRILVLPDHVTHTATGRHDAAPVPWLLYDSSEKKTGGLPYTEEAAGRTGQRYEDGTRLIFDFLE